MLRESIGAAIRGTGRKVARTPLSVWIAALLLVLAVFTSLVSGVRELRLQAQSREALAQVKSARMAARIVSAQCFSAGQPFADFTAADGLSQGLQEEIRELASLPGTVQLTRTDAAGYSVQRLVYQEGAVCAVYDA